MGGAAVLSGDSETGGADSGTGSDGVCRAAVATGADVRRGVVWAEARRVAEDRTEALWEAELPAEADAETRRVAEGRTVGFTEAVRCDAAAAVGCAEGVIRSSGRSTG